MGINYLSVNFGGLRCVLEQSKIPFNSLSQTQILDNNRRHEKVQLKAFLSGMPTRYVFSRLQTQTLRVTTLRTITKFTKEN